MTNQKTQRIAIIIGGGPAGLTAALELVRRSDILPIVIEALDTVGGISRTIVYKGHRMDIGGHRFFSKSDWVMKWWQGILPTEPSSDFEAPTRITYQQQSREITSQNVPTSEHGRMLIRDRLSRIYYLRKFFSYPIKLSTDTLVNLGVIRVFRIGVSYLLSTIFLRRPERTLEDFLINRFGTELYKTFFKDYTEKVWGVPCNQISAEWGAQRIKGLSIISAIVHAVRTIFRNSKIEQHDTNTSLIEKFLYPALGPGQLWEEVAKQIQSGGGTLLLRHTVKEIRFNHDRVESVTVRKSDGGEYELAGDFFISTMPVKDLIRGMGDVPPSNVRKIADALPYRDFITVGLLLKRMKRNTNSLSRQINECPPDNWIYVQESDVRLGRIQVFNNWSPYLCPNPEHIWLGLEYFCQEGDDLWCRNDSEMTKFAIAELERIDLIDAEDVLDSHVVRVPKTYPAYFGAYHEFENIRTFVDRIPNLFLIGRNGMHRYNNQDHSMLTAKLAVDAICCDSTDKSAIWEVNIDDDYHETKTNRSE